MLLKLNPASGLAMARPPIPRRQLLASAAIAASRVNSYCPSDRPLALQPRAARPPEAPISALPRSWPACLRDWHRVARADLVTFVLGAVWNPHAWRNALRGGACRNPGQGNPGGQDESGETHGGTSLWVEPNKGAATRLPLRARVDGLGPRMRLASPRLMAGHLSGNDRATRCPTGRIPSRGDASKPSLGGTVNRW
jgi:hypothetical protein